MHTTLFTFLSVKYLKAVFIPLNTYVLLCVGSSHNRIYLTLWLLFSMTIIRVSGRPGLVSLNQKVLLMEMVFFRSSLLVSPQKTQMSSGGAGSVLPDLGLMLSEQTHWLKRWPSVTVFLLYVHVCFLQKNSRSSSFMAGF